MKTVRELIEKFMYEHLEYHISMVDECGDDTVFNGIRVMDDPEKFVKGALINTTATLYLYYLKSGDKRADKTLFALQKFVKSACKDQMMTWGKLSTLRGMAKLYKAGKLDVIPNEYIEILKEKTNYEDFFSKSELRLRGAATNYMQVAMACAGLRELMGWDKEPYCEKIRDKFISIAMGAENGYMDENPPMARFDRYSILVTSEMSDTLGDVERDVPQKVLDNLAHAAKMCVKMSNEKGDGINYGRSLSCHGDGAVLEIMASAFARGLISSEDRDTALLYSIRIIEKIFNFWYDKELRSFNIWWDGRSTNKYRQEHRVLEVNMDMANHMLTTLENFEAAGLADTIPSVKELPSPNEWVNFEFEFLNREDQVAKTVVLRRGDTLVMLPLVGIGNWYEKSGYMPYPNICGVIEAAPEASYPFLVPEYKSENGDRYRPIQFYTGIEAENDGKTVTVKAIGKLAKYGEKQPVRSEYGFEVKFVFEGDYICAEYVTELKNADAEMLVGYHGDSFECETLGFDTESEVNVSGEYDFKTPTGAITKAVTYSAKNAKALGYKIKLK